MFDEKIYEEFLSCIQNGEEIVLSSEKVSKKHNITAARILGWHYARREGSEMHANFALTTEEDEQLLYSIMAVSFINMDWTLSQIQEACVTIFDKKISTSTAWRFLDRHRDVLTFRKPTVLSKKRCGEDSYESSLVFASRFQEFLSKKKLPPCSIINYDETRIVVNDNSTIQVKRCVVKEKSKPQLSVNVKGTHCRSFLPFVSADGNLIASYLIIRSKFDDAGKSVVNIVLPAMFSRTRQGFPPPVLFFNDTGYLNGEIFSQVMEDFCKTWITLHPGLQCAIIGDNLSIHKDLKVIKEMYQKGLHMTFLPAETTHWSQPLDNLLFARFKQEVSKILQKISWLQSFTSDDLFSLLDIVQTAAKRAFTPKTIMKAFSNTGLYPLDAAKIEELAALNHAPSLGRYEPSKRDDYLVEKVVAGVEKCFKEVKKDIQTTSEKLKPVRVPVKKNLMYLAEDIIEENERKKVDEETRRKEKESEKEKKKEDRKRKREEEERRKQLNLEERQKKRAKRAEELEKRAKEKERHTCKAGCLKTCRIGADWVGCDFCDDFWVCPVCFEDKKVQKQVKQHERLCKAVTVKK